MEKLICISRPLAGIPTWSGGNATLVQVGDIFDRGDDEIAILMTLLHLRKQAAAAGGQVHLLLGNHEMLNVGGDFNEVSHIALIDSAAKVLSVERVRALLSGGKFSTEAVSEMVAARLALFARGGPLARIFSSFSTVLVVNDTVFVHGGLHRPLVSLGLEEVNRQMSLFLLGVKPPDDEQMQMALKAAVASPQAALWSRTYSHFDEEVSRIGGNARVLFLAKFPAADFGEGVFCGSPKPSFSLCPRLKWGLDPFLFVCFVFGLGRMRSPQARLAENWTRCLRALGPGAWWSGTPCKRTAAPGGRRLIGAVRVTYVNPLVLSHLNSPRPATLPPPPNSPTPPLSPNSCDGKIWKIDVGMSSRMYDHPAQILEISPDGEVTVLEADLPAMTDELEPGDPQPATSAAAAADKVVESDGQDDIEIVGSSATGTDYRIP